MKTPSELTLDELKIIGPAAVRAAQIRDLSFESKIDKRILFSTSKMAKPTLAEQSFVSQKSDTSLQSRNVRQKTLEEAETGKLKA
jgi:hypothetical protein